MAQNIPLTKILFLDIETTSQKAHYSELSEKMQALWDRKASYLKNDDSRTSEELYQRAAIYAEFGKIVCISVGIVNENEGITQLRLKSFFGHDETKILFEFRQLIVKSFNTTDKFLCAHNGKEFDYPFIARRMLVNGITLPALLDIAGKKPWEISLLDTMELWKFGDFKHYTSLNLLTEIFDIPSPKDDIDGSMVGKVYWQDNDIERIAHYCEKDVTAVTQLYLRMNNLPLIQNEQIFSIK